MHEAFRHSQWIHNHWRSNILANRTGVKQQTGIAYQKSAPGSRCAGPWGGFRQSARRAPTVWVSTATADSLQKKKFKPTDTSTAQVSVTTNGWPPSTAPVVRATSSRSGVRFPATAPAGAAPWRSRRSTETANANRSEKFAAHHRRSPNAHFVNHVSITASGVSLSPRGPSQMRCPNY